MRRNSVRVNISFRLFKLAVYVRVDGLIVFRRSRLFHDMPVHKNIWNHIIDNPYQGNPSALYSRHNDKDILANSHSNLDAISCVLKDSRDLYIHTVQIAP